MIERTGQDILGYVDHIKPLISEAPLETELVGMVYAITLRPATQEEQVESRVLLEKWLAGKACGRCEEPYKTEVIVHKFGWGDGKHGTSKLTCSIEGVHTATCGCGGHRLTGSIVGRIKGQAGLIRKASSMFSSWEDDLAALNGVHLRTLLK